MPSPDDAPVLTFADAAAWEAWLEEHGGTADAVWVRIAKQGHDEPSVTRAGALDVALCHGWIDGLKRTEDEHWYRQRFTPRRPRSRWSKINREHVARLVAAGRMRPAGQREVDAAKADGRWDAA